MTTSDKMVQAFLRTSGWAVFFILASFALFFVPMNMDEAGIFHSLACLDYPFAHLNLFREACSSQNNLLTPLGFTIARPQFYTGIFHAILYAPFYFVFHAAWGQYIFGLTYLLGFTYFLSGFSENRKLIWPFYLAFFPFVIQFIHDAGPVKFALLLYPLAAYLTRKIISEKSFLRYAYAALIPPLVLIASEEKAFFLYLLPSIVLFSLAMLPQETLGQIKPSKQFFKKITKDLPVLAFIGILTALALSLLLFAKNQQGLYYVTWLLHLTKPELAFTDWLGATLAFLLYWPYYAHNYFTLSLAAPAAFVFGLSVMIFWCALTFYAIKTKGPAILKQPKTFFLFLSFVATLLVFAITGNTWAGHHFIFLILPLMVIGADLFAALDKTPQMALGILYFAINLACPLHLTQASIPVKDSREREAIYAYFNDPERATNAIVSFSSWGAYYIQSLYGPKNQLIAYTEPYEPEAMRTTPIPAGWANGLLTIAQQTGRTIYNVCYDPLCNKEALEAAFGNKLEFNEELVGLREWHIFKAAPVRNP